MKITVSYIHNMTLESRILSAATKDQALDVAKSIGDNRESFELLMNLFLSTQYRECQRAAWILGQVVDEFPEMILPYLPTLLDRLRDPFAHDAVKRNTVRALQFIDIPEDLWGETVDVCFKLLRSGQEPIAVKVFAMTVIFNICRSVPEISEELKITIEDQLPFSSAGFKNRGSKILRALESGSSTLK